MWLGIDQQVEMLRSPLLANDIIKISDAIPIPMPLCMICTFPVPGDNTTLFLGT